MRLSCLLISLSSSSFILASSSDCSALSCLLNKSAVIVWKLFTDRERGEREKEGKERRKRMEGERDIVCFGCDFRFHFVHVLLSMTSFSLQEGDREWFKH